MFAYQIIGCTEYKQWRKQDENVKTKQLETKNSRPDRGQDWWFQTLTLTYKSNNNLQIEVQAAVVLL